MLGTNDLKVWYKLTAPEIAYGAATLVDLALRALAGPGGTPPKVLLVAPTAARADDRQVRRTGGSLRPCRRRGSWRRTTRPRHA